MYTMSNDKSQFIKLIENHADPLVPLLRHNVLNHYRNFLAFMVELKWDDRLILEYIKRHEEMIIIKNPVNDLERFQNKTHMNYLYTNNSLRSMFSKLNDDSYVIPCTMSFIYGKILEKSSRYLTIDNIAKIKNSYPMLDYNKLVVRYFSIEDHVDKFERIRHGITIGVIDHSNIDEVLECIRIGSGKIDRLDFIENLWNVDVHDDIRDIIKRFGDKMTLLNKWW